MVLSVSIILVFLIFSINFLLSICSFVASKRFLRLLLLLITELSRRHSTYYILYENRLYYHPSPDHILCLSTLDSTLPGDVRAEVCARLASGSCVKTRRLRPPRLQQLQLDAPSRRGSQLGRYPSASALLETCHSLVKIA